MSGVKTAGQVVDMLEGVVDLSSKIFAATDQLNNVRMVFENRAPSHIGMFVTSANPLSQEWEIIKPYLGSASLNKLTNIYEPGSALLVTDIVNKQSVTLNLYGTNKGLVNLQKPEQIEISLETDGGGMIHGEITVRIINSTGKELLKVTSKNSFAAMANDTGHGPLMYSVGWADNKYILQVTITNMNVAY